MQGTQKPKPQYGPWCTICPWCRHTGPAKTEHYSKVGKEKWRNTIVLRWMFLKGNAKFQSMFRAHFFYLDGKDQFRKCLPSIHNSISSISISLMLSSFKLLPSTADGDATVSFTSDHAWLWVRELIVWNLSLYSTLCAFAMTGWQGRRKGRHSCSLTTLKNTEVAISLPEFSPDVQGHYNAMGWRVACTEPACAGW